MSLVTRSVRAIAKQCSTTGRTLSCPACSNLLRTTTFAKDFTTSSQASTSRIPLDYAAQRDLKSLEGVRGVATKVEELDEVPPEKLGEVTTTEESGTATTMDEEQPFVPVPYESIFDRPNPPSAPPSAADLDPFRPNPLRMRVPTPSSPDAERLVYAKAWNKTLRKIHLNFTKAQMRWLVDKELHLDLSDDRLKLPTRRKGKKIGQTKKKMSIAGLTIAEMCRMVMILHWDLRDPETLPSIKRSPMVVEGFPISNRTLFLLLLPSSTMLKYFKDSLGIKISHKQDEKTNQTSLVFKGESDTVKAARERVENILETVHQETISLSKRTTVLRPEVFQAISRMAKVFLEPVERAPKQLLATAAAAEDVKYAMELIEHAFYTDSLATQTPLFALLSTSIKPSPNYAMFPSHPLSPPSWSIGGTSEFSRVKKVKISSTLFDDDYTPWHGRPYEIIPVEAAKEEEPEKEKDTLMERLKKGLGGVKESEEVRVDITFGNLVWPLYKPEGEKGIMGPSKSGKWGFERFVYWKKDWKKAFISSTPPSLLEAIGHQSLERSYSSLDSVPSEEAEATTISNELRKITYRPHEAAPRRTVQTLEVEVGEGLTELVLRKRSMVDLMMPEAASDLQVCMTAEEKMSAEVLEKLFNATDLHDPAIALPSRITFKNDIYILHSDKTLRRTSIIPSPTALSQVPLLQERWDEKIAEQPSGVSVSVEVGKGTFGDKSKYWNEKLERSVRDLVGLAKMGEV